MTLDENAVRALLHMKELIPVMASALADLSRGKVVQPVRVMVPVAEHQGFLGIMPAYAGALGAKLVTFYPNNQGIHTHHAVILLFRPETGEPLATLDGRLITEMRTAAVSAVATQLLARPEASVLAILGSGVQARSHLEALRLVREFRDIRVWSPRKRTGLRRAVRRAGRYLCGGRCTWRRCRRRGHDVDDPRATGQVALAGRPHQRSGRCPTHLAGTGR